MAFFIALVSFAGPAIGSCVAGEVVEISNSDQAERLLVAGYIKPILDGTRETTAIQPDAESADIKAPRKKKG
jgi:hypothetical protein